MAHHKSAKKRIRVSERRRIRNKAVMSRIKTLIKKVLSTENVEEAEKYYKEAVSYLDKKTTKGILHKNNTSRKKSRLTRHLNNLQKDISKKDEAAE